ncbi:MAG: MarR family winged helix-turn-helix transcriptional regulator [Dermatophilaceae bacterium]
MAKVSPQDVAKVGCALRHLNLATNRLCTALAAQLPINVTELVALSNLDESEELTPTQLAQLLGITTASVTGMVDHLEAAGFVYRTRSTVDRRSLLLRLTPAGERAIQWVCEQYAIAIAIVFEQGGAALAPDVAVFLEQASKTLTKAALAQPGPGPRPSGQ